MEIWCWWQCIWLLWSLLTPFSVVEKDYPSKDAFNFYLSQMRIHIEQKFGLMTGNGELINSLVSFPKALLNSLILSWMCSHSLKICSIALRASSCCLKRSSAALHASSCCMKICSAALHAFSCCLNRCSVVLHTSYCAWKNVQQPSAFLDVASDPSSALKAPLPNKLVHSYGLFLQAHFPSLAYV